MATIEVKTKKTGEVVYRLRCCVGRDSLNKQVFRSMTIPSPKLTPAKERKAIDTAAAAWETEEKEKYKASPARKLNKRAVTFAEYVDEHWMPNSVKNGLHTPDTVQFYEHMAAPLKGHFGKAPLTAITKEEVIKYLNFMRNTEKQRNGKPLSASTVKHRYDVLRIIFNDAEGFDYITMEQNPFRHIKAKERPKHEQKPVVWMDEAQEKEFMAALDTAPENWRLLVKLMLKTGLRRGEVVGLQWQDIAFEKKQITIQRNVTPAVKGSSEKYHVGKPKSKKARVVPITAEMAGQLKDWQATQAARYDCIALNEAFIFSSDADLFRPQYPTTPTAWLHDFEKKNGLPDMSPHDLRHTFATRAQQKGVDIRTVQTILGHSDAGVTFESYSGTNDDAMREAIEAVQNSAG